MLTAIMGVAETIIMQYIINTSPRKGVGLPNGQTKFRMGEINNSSRPFKKKPRLTANRQNLDDLLIYFNIIVEEYGYFSY